jgi:hypothetical protein
MRLFYLTRSLFPLSFLPPSLREGLGEGVQAMGLKDHGLSTPTLTLPLRGRGLKEEGAHAS